MEKAYEAIPYKLSEMKHEYGPQVHLMADPVLMHLLMRFSTQDVVQPEANRLVQKMYESLLMEALNSFAPREIVTVPTRMHDQHSQAQYRGQAFQKNTRFVCVDLLRAGIYPTHVCFDLLHDFFKPELLRQDHIVASRKTDSTGHVVGVEISGSKIGGPVKDSIVVIPDPMGATGGTAVKTIQKYMTEVAGGPPKAIWLLHLIVTPEYIRRVTREAPHVHIFSIRCDRGMSAPSIFATPFGSSTEERGLNEKDYIVPGAGGVGEILNNSFV